MVSTILIYVCYIRQKLFNGLSKGNTGLFIGGSGLLGLLHADYVAPLAESREELQKMLDLAVGFALDLAMVLRDDKFRVTVFGKIVIGAAY